MEIRNWVIGRASNVAHRRPGFHFPVSIFQFPFSSFPVLFLCFLLVSILFPRPQFGAEAGAAEALIAAGHWKRARALVEPRVAADPRDARAACQLARIKLAFGDLDGALDLAQRAVALEDGSAHYHYQLAEVYEEMASKASLFAAAGYAIKLKIELEASLKRAPHNLDALDDLMQFEFQAPVVMGGDKNKARAIAATIGQLNPVRGYLAQAELAEAGKEFGKQEEWLSKAVQSDPKNYEAQTTLANFYTRIDHRKLEEAGKHAQEAVRLDPGRAKGYSILATVLALEQRWDELDSTLARAESNVPDDPAPYYEAANALLESGVELRRGENYARQYLAQAPEGEEPDTAHAHRLLGLILEKEGRKAEAASELETSLRINPRFRAAKEDLKRIQKSR
jgi:tetratricopeptide (TPR) repeat protein